MFGKLIKSAYRGYCGICGKETTHKGFRCTSCGR